MALHVLAYNLKRVMNNRTTPVKTASNTKNAAPRAKSTCT
jgi:hypothetical protein